MLHRSATFTRTRRISFAGLVATAYTLGSLLTPLWGLTLSINYSKDSDNFFGTNTAAKAALEAAASQLSALITTDLTPVVAPGDVIVGNNLGTTATFNWSYNYTDPSNNADPLVTIAAPNLLANTVTIFAGVKELSGSTLGEGGSGGAGFTLSGSGSGSKWVGAVALANSASNALMDRGGGPIIDTITGTVNLGGVPADYEIGLGLGVGNIWFDVDGNNDGIKDTTPILNGFWHFDHTTPVPAGKNDFYSVALHELIHALGVGSSQSYLNLASGTTWMGPAAVSLRGGSGTGMLTFDQSHLVGSLMSPRLSDGVMQTVVMSPTIVTGTRKSLTLMDVAILSDIGWDVNTTLVIPEPTTTAALSAGALLIIRRRRRRIPPVGLTADGDAPR
jgi:hypothetical protein